MWTNKTVENGETQILSKSMKNLDAARRRQCGVLSQDRHLFIWEWSEGNCDCEWWSVPRNTTRECFIPESRRRNQDFSDIFFQQDGTSNATRQLLLETFPNHVVSRFGDIAWPSRSPDLTSPDVFFLMGLLKVYGLCEWTKHVTGAQRHHPRWNKSHFFWNTSAQNRKLLFFRCCECIRFTGSYPASVIFKKWRSVNVTNISLLCSFKYLVSLSYTV